MLNKRRRIKLREAIDTLLALLTNKKRLVDTQVTPVRMLSPCTHCHIANPQTAVLMFT